MGVQSNIANATAYQGYLSSLAGLFGVNAPSILPEPVGFEQLRDQAGPNVVFMGYIMERDIDDFRAAHPAMVDFRATDLKPGIASYLSPGLYHVYDFTPNRCRLFAVFSPEDATGMVEFKMRWC